MGCTSKIAQEVESAIIRVRIEDWRVFMALQFYYGYLNTFIPTSFSLTTSFSLSAAFTATLATAFTAAFATTFFNLQM